VTSSWGKDGRGVHLDIQLHQGPGKKCVYLYVDTLLRLHSALIDNIFQIEAIEKILLQISLKFTQDCFLCVEG